MVFLHLGCTKMPDMDFIKLFAKHLLILDHQNAHETQVANVCVMSANGIDETEAITLLNDAVMMQDARVFGDLEAWNRIDVARRTPEPLIPSLKRFCAFMVEAMATTTTERHYLLDS